MVFRWSGAVLKNFLVGDFAARINSETQGSITINKGTLGTVLINNSTYSGGTVNGTVTNTNVITGGTINTFTMGTPTLIGGTIVVSGTVTPVQPGAALAPSVGTLTDSAGGTLTANAQASQIFYSAMGTTAGNRTIGTPKNPTDGEGLTYAFKSSGSANGTLVWDSGVFTFSQDIGTPSIGTGTSWNYYSWRYNGVASKWHYMGQSRNVI